MKQLVVADLHINLNYRPGDKIEILRWLLQYAVSQKVERVTVLGDVYHYRHPKPEEQKIFQQWVYGGLRKGLKFLLVKGNHDTLTSRLKTNETYYTFGEFENLKIEGVQVVDPGYIEDGIYYGHLFLNNCSLGAYDTVLGAQVGGISSDQLIASAPKAKLFLLGDVHKHQVVNKNRVGQPPVVYAGSPERVDFGERVESKGCLLVEGLNWKFVETPAREMCMVLEDWTSGAPADSEPVICDGAIVKVKIKIHANQTHLVNESSVRARYVSAAEVRGIEYDIIETEAPRNAEINESKTPVECLEEYAHSKGMSKEVIREGRKVIAEVLRDSK